ncbi:MAG: hypothetical protein QG559_289 [Campylobacterota bacterium]|nr:hypothetical protein [Campylobacterota bacterium]
MLLSQIKEREYRFRLALRMVLPIFALFIALIFHSFVFSKESIDFSFYIESLLIFIFSTYFIFYLIYKGFDTKITDNVSKAFTREYVYKYLNKEIKSFKEYTFLLISVDNLNDINNRYGMSNGDKILFEIVVWINDYLKSKNIVNVPIGHISGSNFIIGLEGNKTKYKSVLELMCLKSEDIQINNIEIQLSGAINDTTFSDNLDYIIENLFELQNQNRESKIAINSEENIDPTELEYDVINALKRKDLVLLTQNVYKGEAIVFRECFIKLKTLNNKILHQKNYMKVLDKLGLMDDYNIVALEKIIQICKKSDDGKYALSLSPTSLRNPFFLIKIKELFYKNESVKNRIILILNENEYYPRIDRYSSILEQLKSFGIMIALDRLGSIHTTFLYLRDLNIDIVRLGSFYTKDKNPSKYKNIINGFCTMAHDKGIKIWAKMVEDEEINTLLKELNIDYLQGKYLAPIEKFEE